MRSCWCWLAMVAAGGLTRAAEPTADFASAAALGAWQVTGDVTFDAARNHGAAPGGSLRVGSGGVAIWRLRETDGSGAVTMWVYDDLSAPANPRDRRVGPRWGLVQGDGRVLVIGAIYAPYLGGATTYATSDSDRKSWFNVQYSALKRLEGWHRWTFDFDPAKGLTITQDGKAKARFDWNQTKFLGFRGVAVFGDDGKDKPQTIWIDDVSATLGGPVTAVPTPPPPPPPVVPATDPAPEKAVEIVPALRGKHPRLLFTADDVAKLRQRAQGPLKASFDRLCGYVPACTPPEGTTWQTDATEAQRQGVWRLPTVALHYVLTGEKRSLDNATGFLRKFLESEHWETGGETDSGMGAANIMTGAALAYDWLYADLDPALRTALGKKLLEHARRQYHRGHLMKAPGVHYWQGDPQNNHRWHRDSGLTLCALAVAGEVPGSEWIVAQALAELQYVTQWLPPDGTSHESSSYLVFGAPYLVLACDAADRCLGTDLLGHDFFRHVPAFRLHTLTPGFKDAFHYGDCAGLGFITDFALRCTARHRQADLQAGLLKLQAAEPKTFEYGWFSLLWRDPALDGGSLDKVARTAFFPDLGMACLRDGWGERSVAAMFKCAPYGGLKLNEYRNKNDYRYINVAHDDPDANMLVLAADGALLADDDRYSTKKVTSSHNTILVNGKGQRQEGAHWTQPMRSGKDGDMTKLAWTTAWRESGEVSLVEGEAGGSYVGLDRYRRTVLWARGSYLLVLDDIRAPKEVEVTWLLQGKEVREVEAGRWELRNGEARCGLLLAADRPYRAGIGVSTADHRGTPLGFQQLQAKASGTQWRVAAVLDPWHRAQLGVKLTADGADRAKVVVSSADFTDEWQWTAAPDGKTASGLSATRRTAAGQNRLWP